MKKNLLFIIDNLKGGGAERILITILQHLDAKKYNVDLFLINREGVYLDSVPRNICLYSALGDSNLLINKIKRRILLTFPSLFYIFLTLKPSKKKFFIISSIFFALRIADVLKGGRSKLFLPIIFLLWYYYSFYSEQQKQKIGKLLLISIVCIILSQVLLEFRRGDVDTGYDSDLFMMFFSQQGVSLLVFAYMIFYKSTFVNTGLPYILYPLSLTSTFEGQSMEFVEQTNSLGHRLTYFLAPDAYLGGEGVGSSFLGEFWDLGLIGFLLMSFLAGYIIRYFEKSVRNTRVIMFLAFILVPNIVYMPRASFFPSLINILIFLFFYSLILYVPKLKIKFI